MSKKESKKVEPKKEKKISEKEAIKVLNEMFDDEENEFERGFHVQGGTGSKVK